MFKSIVMIVAAALMLAGTLVLVSAIPSPVETGTLTTKWAGIRRGF